MAFARKMSLAGLLVLGYLAIHSDGADIIPECPSGFNGNIAYPANCMLYVDCWYGQERVMSCPYTTVFDPAKKFCVPQKDFPECEDGGFIDLAKKKRHPA